MNDEELLRHDGIRILPYVLVQGTYTLPDTFLHWMWARFEEEGSSKKVFVVGEVYGAEAYVAYLRHPANAPIFFFTDDPEHTPLGMAWLNGIEGNHAFLHHALLRAAWGTLTMNVARAAFNYWWGLESDSGPLLEVLIGQSPSKNKLAISYLERAGFTVIGQIPKIAADGDDMTISYLERDNGR